jgi:Beta-lactamase enzyme family
MATLLRLIWRDEAGPAEACAQVRRMMARQVTRQRLALGFPRAGVQVAAKSGSLLGVIRNEVGVRPTEGMFRRWGYSHCGARPARDRRPSSARWPSAAT